MLAGKKIVLGVCASIAAYKSAFLTRLLVQAGAEVRVVLTPAATDFVGPITFSTLSKNKAVWQFTDDQGATWNNHVALGLWADLLLIAPLSAATLSKLASGHCDNLLVATYLSAKCPVVVAPAMDLDMYQHPTTQQNLQQLITYGNQVIPATDGELASGLSGQGRMAEPADIVDWLTDYFSQHQPLAGKHVLLTAGPTREPIDPVRYISNHSSGKMGIALAQAFRDAGAAVTLVLGPTHETPPEGVAVVPVERAADMYEAVASRFAAVDLFVAAAAVADFTPAQPALQKHKKEAGVAPISLTSTKDILAEMGAQKEAHQFVVGFALETEKALQHAQDKLTRKNLDLIVVNTLEDAGAGFGHDTNKVTLLDKRNKTTVLELQPKTEIAKKIVQHIIDIWHEA